MGNNIQLTIEENTLISEIKNQIKEIEKIEEHRQVLFYKSKELSDKLKIKDINIQNEDKLMLKVKKEIKCGIYINYKH